MALPEPGTYSSPQGLEQGTIGIEDQLFGPEPQNNTAKADHQFEASPLLGGQTDEDNSNAVSLGSTVISGELGNTLDQVEILASSMACPLRSDDTSTLEEVRLQKDLESGSDDALPTTDIASSIAEALQANVTDLPPVTMPTSVSVASIEGSQPSRPGSPDGGQPSAQANSSVDTFTKSLMAQAKRLRSAVFNNPDRVSFTDVARNPLLARAARAELTGEEAPPLELRPHDSEVERQRIAVEAADADALEEGRINRELAALMLARLDASRKAAEKLLGVLQALAAAEGAYTRAMTAVSKITLVGDCDGATLRAALHGFSDLPFVVGQAHVKLQEAMQEAGKGIQQVVAEVRQECADIQAASDRVHRGVHACRRALHAAFDHHQHACLAADNLGEERAQGRPHVADVDPWLTEARLLTAHQALHKGQVRERAFLAEAFKRVRLLEARRMSAIRSGIETFLQVYKDQVEKLRHSTGELAGLAEAVDSEADLRDLSVSAETAAETGRALASRQAEALDTLRQDLLSSPEIVRQGEMARWVSGSGKWMDCHFVLTRMGFLHWLNSPEDVLPTDGLNLARCHFEQGEAPVFNITESETTGFMSMFSRGRTNIFKAPSVEDCCEWAIALREAIAENKPG
eukprot:jgi/Botrbrau1/2092/Bobra.0047s0050.1